MELKSTNIIIIVMKINHPQYYLKKLLNYLKIFYNFLYDVNYDNSIVVWNI